MASRLLLILLILTAPQARAAEWPAGRAGQARTGAVPAETLPPYALAWSRSVAAPSAGDPLVAFSRVFVTDAASRVTVLDLGTGAPVWASASGAGPNELRVYDLLSGRIRWARTVGGAIVRVPQVNQAEACVVTADGRVQAMHQGDGSVHWTARVAAPVTPAATDGRLVVVGSGNGAEAFDATSGSRAFSAKLGEPLAFLPAVTADGAYLPLARAVVAVDRTGRRRWRAELPHGLAAPLAVSASGVVAACTDGRVRLLDLRTGHLAWESLVAGVPTTIAQAGPVVYVGTASGGLAGVRASDGAPTWAANVGHGGITGLAAADGLLVVTCGAWTAALRPAPQPPATLDASEAAGTVRMGWGPGVANGSPLTGYRVWRRRGTDWSLAGTTGSGTRWFAEAPFEGRTDYAVTAVAADGSESVPSPIATAAGSETLVHHLVVTPQPYDSRSGALTIAFDLRIAARVTWAVVDAQGTALIDDRVDQLPRGHAELTWDGRDRTGAPVEPGACRVRLTAQADGLADATARAVAVSWDLSTVAAAGNANGAGGPGGGAGGSLGGGVVAGSAGAGTPHDNGVHNGANPNGFVVDHRGQGKGNGGGNGH